MTYGYWAGSCCSTSHPKSGRSDWARNSPTPNAPPHAKRSLRYIANGVPGSETVVIKLPTLEMEVLRKIIETLIARDNGQAPDNRPLDERRGDAFAELVARMAEWEASPNRGRGRDCVTVLIGLHQLMNGVGFGTIDDLNPVRPMPCGCQTPDAERQSERKNSKRSRSSEPGKSRGARAAAATGTPSPARAAAPTPLRRRTPATAMRRTKTAEHQLPPTEPPTGRPVLTTVASPPDRQTSTTGAGLTRAPRRPVGEASQPRRNHHPNQLTRPGSRTGYPNREAPASPPTEHRNQTGLRAQSRPGSGYRTRGQGPWGC